MTTGTIRIWDLGFWLEEKNVRRFALEDQSAVHTCTATRKVLWVRHNDNPSLGHGSPSCTSRMQRQALVWLH